MNPITNTQLLLASHLGKTPDTGHALFVADNATVVGDVVLGPSSSVFYGAVLRGDPIQDFALCFSRGGF